MAQPARPLEPEVQIPREREGKYLTFSLAREDYGLEILKVREIIGMMDITAVPQTPDYVKGLINLRGQVIPVIDLRLKFGLPEADYGERTCIIVVEVAGDSGPLQVGVVVDSVSEVLNIGGQDIDPPPTISTNLKTRYLSGIAKGKGTIKILLDIDRVLVTEELAGLEGMSG